jgi:HD-GYP domain-containing protein (c-di-GMP phosphodiesterase class II)
MDAEIIKERRDSMSKQTLDTDKLEIGMYVELPESWFAHDFLKNSFIISSPEQLKQLQNMKLRQVTVDFARSKVKPKANHKKPAPIDLPQSRIKDPKLEQAPKKWSSEKLMPDDLRNVLDDQQLAPEKKSVAVYKHSVTMMEQLLEFPSAENIKASKQAIYQISDMVMADGDTAKNMLLITSHDFYTYTHSVNVGITSIMLSKEIFKGTDAHDLHELAAGYFLHDLGKIHIDPNVLNKPARLTDLEMQHIRTHPYQGYKLLQAAEALSPECSAIVMQHHEAYDGSGYPRRLKQKEIHIYGRICAIADVFDALTAERSYKKAMKPFDALQLMKQQMIDKFDQRLFAEFVRIYL